MELDLATLEGLADLAQKTAETGNTWLLLPLGLAAIVFAVRFFLSAKVPFFATKAGGALLTLALALAGGLASSLLSGKGMSTHVLIDAAKIAFTAAGGWTLLKHLLTPGLEALKAKLGQPVDAEALKKGAEAAAEKVAQEAQESGKVISIEDAVKGEDK